MAKIIRKIRRSGGDRRKFSYAHFVPERRKRKRRLLFDRRVMELIK